jgi:hypothetical protein
MRMMTGNNKTMPLVTRHVNPSPHSKNYRWLVREYDRRVSSGFQRRAVGDFASGDSALNLRRWNTKYVHGKRHFFAGRKKSVEARKNMAGECYKGHHLQPKILITCREMTSTRRYGFRRWEADCVILQACYTIGSGWLVTDAQRHTGYDVMIPAGSLFTTRCWIWSGKTTK